MAAGISEITEAQVRPARAAARVRASWLRPSLLDLSYIAILLWLVFFTVAGGAAGLLQDAFTGVHARIGEAILQHGVPHTDTFSFTKPGEPWFAWEWLASIGFAVAYGADGFRLLTVGCAAIIAASGTMLFRHMAARGANLFVVVLLFHVAVAASSIHYLARPHIFTLLFFAISLWVIDRDRAEKTSWLWVLIPLTAVWVNLHGGFAGMIVTVALFAVGSLLNRDFAYAKRYAILAAGMTLASGLNPYGFREHAHLVEYLNAAWLRDMVEEFQQPHFDSQAGVYFEIVFALAALTLVCLAKRREFGALLVIAFWTHASLRSVRHIPVLALALMPFAASEAQRGWEWMVGRQKRGSLARMLDSIAADYRGALQRVSIWPVLVTVFVAMPIAGIAFPKTFSDDRYPVTAVERNKAAIEGHRVFAPDNWGDFLLFRLPGQKVFIDGRSDFYGEKFSKDYLDILYGRQNWQELLDRYGVDTVMAPSQSAVVSLVRESNRWTKVDDDGSVAIFRKR